MPRPLAFLATLALVAGPALANDRPGPTPRVVDAVIRDLDGKPAVGAVVVAGFRDKDRPNHQVFKTDAGGRFAWTIPEGDVSVAYVVHKEGRSPLIWMDWMEAKNRANHLEWQLRPPTSFEAKLVDAGGRPLAGARVRAEMIGHGGSKPGDREGIQVDYQNFTYVHNTILKGSPLQGLFETTTDNEGRFTFRDCQEHGWLKLGVTTADGTSMRVRSETPPPDFDQPPQLDADPAVLRKARGNPLGTDMVAARMAEMGFLAAPAGQETRLVAVPSARLAGRVTSSVPGLGVAGLQVLCLDSEPGAGPGRITNFNPPRPLTDAEGRFVIDGLDPNIAIVYVLGDGFGERWTQRRAKNFRLVRGETAEVAIELIRGVEVQGTARARGTGAPIENVLISSDAAGKITPTDARGRFHSVLPPGKTNFYVSGPPTGFTTTEGQSRRTVTIPEDVTRFEVPPLELVPSVTGRGRVIDAKGAPIAGAAVVGVANEEGVRLPMLSQETTTDINGAFRLLPAPNNTIPLGQPMFLRVHLTDGTVIVAKATPAADGEVEIKVDVPGAR